MRAPRRAKNVLNSLIENRICTDAGIRWLTVATDPFHDTEIVCDGYPDISTARSLVQTVTVTQAISHPPGIPTGDSWDAHIFFNPCTTPLAQIDPANPVVPVSNFYGASVDQYGWVQDQPTPIGIDTYNSGLNCRAVVTGSNSSLRANGASYPSLGLPAQFQNGAFRLIAVGYEVQNTTAEIYKQGAVTSYKTPAALNESTFIVSTDPATYQWQTGVGNRYTAPVHTQLTQGPALTQAQAALYPNSRTWEAKEGVYAVCTLNRPPNYVLPTAGKMAGLMLTTPQGEPAFPPMGVCLLPYCDITTPNGTWDLPNNNVLPYDVTGSIFTGLNYLSTLQITVRYVFERVPAVTEPNLLVLARTPAPYDPVTLEIYSRAMSSLPVAVMVKDNPLGEWFNDIMDTVAKYAPMMGTALGTVVPGAGALGTALGTAAGMARTMNGPQKKKKKKQAPGNSQSLTQNSKPPRNPQTAGRASNKRAKGARPKPSSWEMSSKPGW